MNNISRQEIIQFVRQATTPDNRFSATSYEMRLPASFTATLKDMTLKYGKQQDRVEEVNRWFWKLKNKDFTGKPIEDIEWLNEWLSELP
jgi:hypothetical protein